MARTTRHHHYFLPIAAATGLMAAAFWSSAPVAAQRAFEPRDTQAPEPVLRRPENIHRQPKAMLAPGGQDPTLGPAAHRQLRPSPRPDLVLWLVPPTQPGQALRYIVRNNGDASTGPFSVGFYCKRTPGPGQIPEVCTFVLKHFPQGLPPSKSIGVYAQAVNPSDGTLAGGLWELTAMVDSSHTVAESDEQNNLEQTQWCLESC